MILSLIVEPILHDDFTCVLYMYTLYINCNFIQSERVSLLRQKLAETVDLRPDDVMIFRSDDEEFEDHMILKDCDIAVGQILECYPRVQLDNISYSDPDVIYIKCQGKKIRTTQKLPIKLHTPMKQLRDDYAAKMGLDPDRLKLSFDGEIIDLKDTPHMLELETGYTIDVVEIP